MYFNPLTAWLVALLSNGIVASSHCVNDSQMKQHYKEMAKRTNGIMNGSILRIRDKGYYSAELALEDIKLHVECAQKARAIQQGYANLEISRESYDFIMKLCDECRVEYLNKYNTDLQLLRELISKGKTKEELTDLYNKVVMFRRKAESYTSILESARKGMETVVQKEEEKARKLEKSDSNGVTILKCILVIGLCILGFTALANGGAAGIVILLVVIILSGFILS